MIRPAGELANRSAHDVGGEYVQAAIITERIQAFARIGPVQIAGDDHGVARCLAGLGPGRRRNESNLLAIG